MGLISKSRDEFVLDVLAGATAFSGPVSRHNQKSNGRNQFLTAVFWIFKG